VCVRVCVFLCARSVPPRHPYVGSCSTLRPTPLSARAWRLRWPMCARVDVPACLPCISGACGMRRAACGVPRYQGHPSLSSSPRCPGTRCWAWWLGWPPPPPSQPHPRPTTAPPAPCRAPPPAVPQAAAGAACPLPLWVHLPPPRTTGPPVPVPPWQGLLQRQPRPSPLVPPRAAHPWGPTAPPSPRAGVGVGAVPRGAGVGVAPPHLAPCPSSTPPRCPWGHQVSVEGGAGV
jgi:hypothetical protein